MKNKNIEQFFGLKEKLNVPEHEGIYRLMARGIVNVIEHHLETNNISRTEFAEKLGINVSQLSVWLSGEHNFTLRSLARVQVALGTPVILTGNALFNYYRLKEQAASNRSIPSSAALLEGIAPVSDANGNFWLTKTVISKKKLSNVAKYGNV